MNNRTRGYGGNMACDDMHKRKNINITNECKKSANISTYIRIHDACEPVTLVFPAEKNDSGSKCSESECNYGSGGTYLGGNDQIPCGTIHSETIQSGTVPCGIQKYVWRLEKKIADNCRIIRDLQKRVCKNSNKQCDKMCLRETNVIFHKKAVIHITFAKNAVLKVTCQGGGGAGGIGCAVNYCYICGSGGGAGEGCVRIFNVKCGEKWIITIGGGGDSRYSKPGEETTVHSIMNDEEQCILKTKGGTNGSPSLNQINTITADSDADDIDFEPLLMPGYMPDSKGCDTCIGKGEPGECGGVSMSAVTGNGGCTDFTGPGGRGGDASVMTGMDGTYGSGGGGSLPHIMDMDPESFSGSGGDGYVRIEQTNDNNCKIDHIIKNVKMIC